MAESKIKIGVIFDLTGPLAGGGSELHYLGAKIMIQGNTAIGTVDDIVFDDAGNLEYLIVAHDYKLVTVPWEAAKFDLKSQTAVVNITPEVYKTIPTYTTTTYPDFFVPTYRTTTYKYYGMTPRELRRIERIVRP